MLRGTILLDVTVFLVCTYLITAAWAEEKAIEYNFLSTYSDIAVGKSVNGGNSLNDLNFKTYSVGPPAQSTSNWVFDLGSIKRPIKWFFFVRASDQ